ncbi:MAG: hypothetical protein K2W96_02635 [Gemmataceae bacterium]|nr:hypothetical protein [Gemmataceae bacterium]
MIQMAHHLANDPEEWGDPLFNYHKLALRVCRGPTPLFLVRYVVDAVNRLVYVRGLTPSPGSRLRGSVEGALTPALPR